MRRSSLDCIQGSSKTILSKNSVFFKDNDFTRDQVDIDYSIESDLLRRQHKESAKRKYRLLDVKSTHLLKSYLSNLQPLPPLPLPLETSTSMIKKPRKNDSKELAPLPAIFEVIKRKKRLKLVHIKPQEGPLTYLSHRVHNKIELNPEQSQVSSIQTSRVHTPRQMSKNRLTSMSQKELSTANMTPDCSFFKKGKISNEHQEKFPDIRVSRDKDHLQKRILDRLNSQISRLKGQTSTPEIDQERPL